MQGSQSFIWLSNEGSAAFIHSGCIDLAHMCLMNVSQLNQKLNTQLNQKLITQLNVNKLDLPSLRHGVLRLYSSKSLIVGCVQSGAYRNCNGNKPRGRAAWNKQALLLVAATAVG